MRFLLFDHHIFVHLATNEWAVEVLNALLYEYFETKVKCRGQHASLLKQISTRVKVLQNIREFMEKIFGQGNEGHEGIDPYQLAKMRTDIKIWESFISDCYVVLRAMRGPFEALGELYKHSDYKEAIKTIVLDLSIIMDNFKMPTGW